MVDGNILHLRHNGLTPDANNACLAASVADMAALSRISVWRGRNDWEKRQWGFEEHNEKKTRGKEKER
jgi:hypothetical protein